jgi:hypothetical protein
MTPENPLLTMIREVCALGRAELERPSTAEGDPDAGRALVQGVQAIDPGGEPSDISLSLPLLTPRAPYFDRLVLDAIAAGVSQVVNLGAGYDDRAPAVPALRRDVLRPRSARHRDRDRSPHPYPDAIPHRDGVRNRPYQTQAAWSCSRGPTPRNGPRRDRPRRAPALGQQDDSGLSA